MTFGDPGGHKQLVDKTVLSGHSGDNDLNTKAENNLNPVAVNCTHGDKPCK